MGVLHAEFDPVSFALMRQALETYNDALWRLDGGRDATPGQIRDNRQRLADSLFEMITDRNALATIDHPAAHPPNTAHPPQTNDKHRKHNDTDRDTHSDTGRGHRSDADRDHNSDHGPSRNNNADRGGHNVAEQGHNNDVGHDAHSDADRGGHNDTDRDHNNDHGPDRNSAADRGGHNVAEQGHNNDVGHDAHSDVDHGVLSVRGPGHYAQARDRTERPRHGGAGEARHGSGGDVPDSPAGRSIDRWRPAQAPNQLIVIAEIGVIDGTKPDGTCELLGAGPVPPAILDNLSPDTRIRGALFDTNGEILWLGRSRRHASAAQQLAVAIRDRGCVLCRAPMHRCHDHHINEWAADNGTTDIPNLAALCNDCHNKLHNNNERLERRTAPRRWSTTPRTNTTSQTNYTTAKGPP